MFKAPLWRSGQFHLGCSQLPLFLSSFLALSIAGGTNELTLAQTQTSGVESRPAENKADSKKDGEKTSELKPKQVKIGGIHWYVDYDAALEIAQQENKPIWLHFGENPG